VTLNVSRPRICVLRIAGYTPAGCSCCCILRASPCTVCPRCAVSARNRARSGQVRGISSTTRGYEKHAASSPRTRGKRGVSRLFDEKKLVDAKRASLRCRFRSARASSSSSSSSPSPSSLSSSSLKRNPEQKRARSGDPSVGSG